MSKLKFQINVKNKNVKSFGIKTFGIPLAFGFWHLDFILNDEIFS
jgi:hypothetical protein